MKQDHEESGIMYTLRVIFGFIVILVILAIIKVTGYLEEYNRKLRKKKL